MKYFLDGKEVNLENLCEALYFRAWSANGNPYNSYQVVLDKIVGDSLYFLIK